MAERYAACCGRELRTHQAAALAKLLAAHGPGARSLVHHAPGSGKTDLMLVYIAECFRTRRARLAVVTAPLAALVLQTRRIAEERKAQGLLGDVEILSAQTTLQLRQQLEDASRPTLLVVEFQKLWQDEILGARFDSSECVLLIDEAHLGLSDAPEAITEAYIGMVFSRSARTLLTGTPTPEMLVDYGSRDGDVLRPLHAHLGFELDVEPVALKTCTPATVVGEWEQLAPGWRLLVAVKSITDVRKVQRELQDLLPDARVRGFHSTYAPALGDLRPGSREESDALADVDVYVCCRRFLTGHDDPRIATVVLLGGSTTASQLLQVAGRCNRPKAGKPPPRLVHALDPRLVNQALAPCALVGAVSPPVPPAEQKRRVEACEQDCRDVYPYAQLLPFWLSQVARDVREHLQRLLCLHAAFPDVPLQWPARSLMNAIRFCGDKRQVAAELKRKGGRSPPRLPGCAPSGPKPDADQLGEQLQRLTLAPGKRARADGENATPQQHKPRRRARGPLAEA